MASHGDSDSARENSRIRVAQLGNSIQYYHDCPRLLEWMLRTRYDIVEQDSCFRGGASFQSLLEQGNGMRNKFGSPNALREDGSYDIGSPTVENLLAAEREWDFIVMNDYTQAPARDDSLADTMKTLKEGYLPLLQPSPSAGKRTVVLLMTSAYRKPAKGSDDLGTFDEFTAKIKEGYALYQTILPGSRIAPVGLAFQMARNRFPSPKEETDPCSNDGFHWEMLYAIDNFHPSPHGTLLEAFVLYATMVGQAPPQYNIDWWKTARYMQPAEMEPLPLPTEAQAKLLRSIACEVCGFDEASPDDRGSSRL